MTMPAAPSSAAPNRARVWCRAGWRSTSLTAALRQLHWLPLARRGEARDDLAITEVERTPRRGDLTAVGSPLLAAYAVLVVQVAAFLSLWVEGIASFLGCGFGAYVCLFEAGALVALVAAVSPGRWRMWRTLLLFGAACIGFVAPLVQPSYARHQLTALWVAAAVPMLAAAVLAAIGEEAADRRRRAPWLVVLLMLAGAVLALPGAPQLPYKWPGAFTTIGLYPLAAASGLAVSAAAYLRSRPRAAAGLAVAAGLLAGVGIFDAAGWEGGTVVSWLIVMAPLGSAAVLAWRWGRGLRARGDGAEGSVRSTVEREP